MHTSERRRMTSGGTRGRIVFLALAVVGALVLLPLSIAATNPVPATRSPGSTLGAYTQIATRGPGTILSTTPTNPPPLRIGVNNRSGSRIQIFPYDVASSYYDIGLQADIAFPRGTNVSPDWTAGPLGMRFDEVPSQPFIEVGPSNFAPLTSDPNGPHSNGLYAYAAWVDANDTYFTSVFTMFSLADGGTYHYFINRISGTTWQTVMCGGSTCYQIATADTGQIHYTTVVSGGEANDSSAHWGTMVKGNHGYFPEGGSVYFPWCYQDVIYNQTTNPPSSCYDAGDGNLDSWTITY